MESNLEATESTLSSIKNAIPKLESLINLLKNTVDILKNEVFVIKAILNAERLIIQISVLFAHFPFLIFFKSNLNFSPPLSSISFSFPIFLNLILFFLFLFSQFLFPIFLNPTSFFFFFLNFFFLFQFF